MRTYRTLGAFCASLAIAMVPATAAAESLVLSKLTGLTGDPAAGQTAVYRADLSTLSGLFQSISISDASGNFGGSAGQFSGFDLDAIKLSSDFCTTAACAAAATGLNVFNFGAGVLFTPGTQRAPTDPKLFGTGPGGNTVDNAVATLGLFDGFSSTVTPDGFLSLGDNGTIAFNLSSLLSGTGLYLYLGEVGDNGEVAGSSITVSPNAVPEPATWLMLILGFGTLGSAMRRRSATAKASRMRLTYA